MSRQENMFHRDEVFMASLAVNTIPEHNHTIVGYFHPETPSFEL